MLYLNGVCVAYNFYQDGKENISIISQEKFIKTSIKNIRLISYHPHQFPELLNLCLSLSPIKRANLNYSTITLQVFLALEYFLLFPLSLYFKTCHALYFATSLPHIQCMWLNLITHQYKTHLLGSLVVYPLQTPKGNILLQPANLIICSLMGLLHLMQGC